MTGYLHCMSKFIVGNAICKVYMGALHCAGMLGPLVWNPDGWD